MASRPSSTIRPTTTPTMMAADVRALLDHLGIGRADVMGYSMGARITAFLALESPELVRSIVLGGLGMHLVEGVGLPESIADALEAPSLGRRHRPAGAHVPRVRRPDQIGPPGARRLHPRLAPGADARAGGIDPDARAGRGRHHAISSPAPPRSWRRSCRTRRLAADPGPRSHARGRRQGVQGGRAGVPSGERMTRASAPAAAMFTGASGNTLVGDVYGEEGPPVLLLHGGGQTRHAWKKTGELIARMGRVAYAVDQRGHGDSEWVEDGAYQYEDFAADARVLADTLARAERRAPGGGRRLARRHGGAAGERRRARARCFPRSCWSTSPRASTAAASPRSRASCARRSARASARSPKPPTRSPPTCRTGRGRARTRG